MLTVCAKRTVTRRITTPSLPEMVLSMLGRVMTLGIVGFYMVQGVSDPGRLPRIFARGIQLSRPEQRRLASRHRKVYAPSPDS